MYLGFIVPYPPTPTATKVLSAAVNKKDPPPPHQMTGHWNIDFLYVMKCRHLLLCSNNLLFCKL
jgi:hypothetical protein